jgi:cytochrome c551/c552/glucose/arabinose dehydrogenase
MCVFRTILGPALAISLLLSLDPLAARSAAIEWEDLRAGLPGMYRSLIDPQATWIHVDSKPAFHWGFSSPHPRLPAGPFQVNWTGVLWVRDAGPVFFHAFVCGEVHVEVDGVVVLDGRGQELADRVDGKQALNRDPGLYRLAVRYRSLKGLPARLQLEWEGLGFARQAIPGWHFKHLPADLPKDAVQEERAEQGRSAVGKYGCARCHASALPGVTDPPPGPSLADIKGRIRPDWLLSWLEDPAKMRSGAHMPALFTIGREGFAERWLVTEHLLGLRQVTRSPPAGNHREGRIAFIRLGCGTCHLLPDLPTSEQPGLERLPFLGLGDRFSGEQLASFLGNPRGRYPDGRMPHVPVSPAEGRDIAAYLLLWSKPTAQALPEAPSDAEIGALVRRMGARTRDAAAEMLVKQKGCAACHPGLPASSPQNIALAAKSDDRGCLSGKTLPRFRIDSQTRQQIAAYRRVSAQEKYASAFAERQRLLERSGCLRCHVRDSDRPPAIEQVGSTLGSSMLEAVPYQRTPRLTFAHQAYEREYLLKAVREGVSGLKGLGYSYRMPAFGADADALVQALAEADGDVPSVREPVGKATADPTLGSLVGASLAGFEGYSCISCHVWDAKRFADPDTGAIGPDLTRIAGRIRRDWFDRFLEDPGRVHPGTPMPAIFPHGKTAILTSVLNGDARKQADALWAYFALGKQAPSPKPAAPLPIDAPAPGEPAIVAQIPIRLPDGTVVESICILNDKHDLAVYDLASHQIRGFYTGAEILRHAHGRLRYFSVAGIAANLHPQREEQIRELFGENLKYTYPPVYQGYDRLSDGVCVRWKVPFISGVIDVSDSLHVMKTARMLVRSAMVKSEKRAEALSWNFGGIPAASSPSARKLPKLGEMMPSDGSQSRAGYRAIAYPSSKTVAGDDRILPAALAVHPRTGRVFVASWKTGELFTLEDPKGDGRSARFVNYALGLFQDALAMLAEDDALYVLQRRNLTRIPYADAGAAEHFDRVFPLPHGVADAYDYAYGLVRDKTGGFIISYAPYANASMPGSGGAVRLRPGKKPEEMAYGFRNPLGWCTGPEREVFFTDNQGEWVATNKLCHLVKGRFYGFPNPSQKEHTSKPFGKTAVWVPYGWAHSLNGVAYDASGGQFGPFSGQFFLAELMFGGAIIRAQVEKVNGEYQGACFPFWGKGLLGPLTLAFGPGGHLYVGSITEPGWMAQPDRGALFRIDFTGPTPFEMQEVHVQPRGFRIVFTTSVDAKTAGDPSSYRLEHFRYEYTGAYGSPELDRTPVTVSGVKVAADRRSVELTTSALVEGRVYLIRVPGVRSAAGQAVVNPMAAYTLNAIPHGGQ